MRANILIAILLMTTVLPTLGNETKPDQPELIPLEVLFGNPTRSGYFCHPSAHLLGTRLAYAARW